MKRLRRILAGGLAVLSLGLLVLLVVGCFFSVKQPLGFRYQRLNISNTPDGSQSATPHFYSAGVQGGRIVLCHWYGYEYLIQVRTEDEVNRRMIGYYRSILA